LALVTGFGGLLALLALTGLDAVSVLSQIRTRNAAIRREFLERSRGLEQIRAMLYLSGTYARDYLLEPDPVMAAGFRARVDETRRQIDARLAAYGALVRPEEREPFRNLQREVGAYWQSLAPVLSWDAARRRAEGYAFLRDEVSPRRSGMLSLADRISAVNQTQLEAADQRLAGLFLSFRDRLGLTLAATLGLGLLVAAASMRHILRLERRTASHLAALDQARSELKELSARLVEAQENERKALSRELHDTVGQTLSAVLMELRNLSASSASASAVSAEAEMPASVAPGPVTAPPAEATGPGGPGGHMETIRRLVESAVDVVRNMALMLRPSMLDDLGLVPALQWQARETSRRTGMLVHVAADDLPDDLPDGHRTCVYRVVQEALTNSAKHSAARQVWITLRAGGGEIRLSVKDDGRGFASGRERGLGLLGLQERAAHLGGSLEVATEPGRGTLLAVMLPLPDGGRGADLGRREGEGEGG
jgi:signal transduction histidine kinase